MTDKLRRAVEALRSASEHYVCFMVKDEQASEMLYVTPSDLRALLAERDELAALNVEFRKTLLDLQNEYTSSAGQQDEERRVTYTWSLTRIGYALALTPPAALEAQRKREAEIRREVARECVEMAEAASKSWWQEFKTGEHRGDPHYQGMSDGASEVADGIRKRFGLDATAEPKETQR